MPSFSPSRSAAFSLVELSIVLVILGLLVGGVLAGRSLIHAAELRKVTVEYQQWQTATNSFKIKYHAMPGDFTKATQFWGNAGKCPTWVDGALSNDGRTCDGNGNGVIAEWPDAFTFWQHLGNAGLIEGRYNGFVQTPGTPMMKGGETFPASKLPGGVWHIQSAGTSLIGSYTFMNEVYFTTMNASDLGILSPEDAWGIDTKIDDGAPYSGAVNGLGDHGCLLDSAGNDTTFASGNATQYKLSEPSKSCALMFNL